MLSPLAGGERSPSGSSIRKRPPPLQRVDENAEEKRISDLLDDPIARQRLIDELLFLQGRRSPITSSNGSTGIPSTSGSPLLPLSQFGSPTASGSPRYNASHSPSNGSASPTLLNFPDGPPLSPTQPRSPSFNQTLSPSQSWSPTLLAAIQSSNQHRQMLNVSPQSSITSKSPHPNAVDDLMEDEQDPEMLAEHAGLFPPMQQACGHLFQNVPIVAPPPIPPNKMLPQNTMRSFHVYPKPTVTAIMREDEVLVIGKTNGEIRMIPFAIEQRTHREPTLVAASTGSPSEVSAICVGRRSRSTRCDEIIAINADGCLRVIQLGIHFSNRKPRVVFRQAIYANICAANMTEMQRHGAHVLVVALTDRVVRTYIFDDKKHAFIAQGKVDTRMHISGVCVGDTPLKGCDMWVMMMESSKYCSVALATHKVENVSVETQPCDDLFLIPFRCDYMKITMGSFKEVVVYANTRERRLINIGKEIVAAGTLRIHYDENQTMNVVVTVDIAGMASVYAYNSDTIKRPYIPPVFRFETVHDCIDLSVGYKGKFIVIAVVDNMSRIVLHAITIPKLWTTMLNQQENPVPQPPPLRPLYSGLEEEEEKNRKVAGEQCLACLDDDGILDFQAVFPEEFEALTYLERIERKKHRIKRNHLLQLRRRKELEECGELDESDMEQDEEGAESSDGVSEGTSDSQDSCSGNEDDSDCSFSSNPSTYVEDASDEEIEPNPYKTEEEIEIEHAENFSDAEDDQNLVCDCQVEDESDNSVSGLINTSALPDIQEVSAGEEEELVGIAKLEDGNISEVDEKTSTYREGSLEIGEPRCCEYIEHTRGEEKVETVDVFVEDDALRGQEKGDPRKVVHTSDKVPRLSGEITNVATPTSDRVAIEKRREDAAIEDKKVVVECPTNRATRRIKSSRALFASPTPRTPTTSMEEPSTSAFEFDTPTTRGFAMLTRRLSSPSAAVDAIVNSLLSRTSERKRSDSSNSEPSRKESDTKLQVSEVVENLVQSTLERKSSSTGDECQGSDMDEGSIDEYPDEALDQSPHIDSEQYIEYCPQCYLESQQDELEDAVPEPEPELVVPEEPTTPKQRISNSEYLRSAYGRAMAEVEEIKDSGYCKINTPQFPYRSDPLPLDPSDMRGDNEETLKEKEDSVREILAKFQGGIAVHRYDQMDFEEDPEFDDLAELKWEQWIEDDKREKMELKKGRRRHRSNAEFFTERVISEDDVFGKALSPKPLAMGRRLHVVHNAMCNPDYWEPDPTCSDLQYSEGFYPELYKQGEELRIRLENARLIEFPHPITPTTSVCGENSTDRLDELEGDIEDEPPEGGTKEKTVSFFDDEGPSTPVEEYVPPIIYRDDLNYGMYNPLYIPPHIREKQEREERERKRKLGIEEDSDEEDVWRRRY